MEAFVQVVEAVWVGAAEPVFVSNFDEIDLEGKGWPC